LNGIVATRYDKLAANYLAFVQLASIRLWLRVNEFTPLEADHWIVDALGAPHIGGRSEKALISSFVARIA
jgi:hypothetical protein